MRLALLHDADVEELGHILVASAIRQSEPMTAVTARRRKLSAL
jgi:hypothetical protein